MVPKPPWPQRCSSNPARTRSLPRSAAVALTTGQFVLNDWFESDCAEQKNFCGTRRRDVWRAEPCPRTLLSEENDSVAQRSENLATKNGRNASHVVTLQNDLKRPWPTKY